MPTFHIDPDKLNIDFRRAYESVQSIIEKALSMMPAKSDEASRAVIHKLLLTKSMKVFKGK